MGWEDIDADPDSDEPVDERGYPRSFPRTEAGHDMEMRNLEEPEPFNGGNGNGPGEHRSNSRSDTPLDGVRQRPNGTNSEAQKDADAQEGRKNKEDPHKNQREVPVAVVEQRVSNLAQGCLCKCLLTLEFDRL